MLGSPGLHLGARVIWRLSSGHCNQALEWNGMAWHSVVVDLDMRQGGGGGTDDASSTHGGVLQIFRCVEENNSTNLHGCFWYCYTNTGEFMQNSATSDRICR
jgi:hypothetical protein